MFHYNFILKRCLSEFEEKVYKLLLISTRKQCETILEYHNIFILNLFRFSSILTKVYKMISKTYTEYLIRYSLFCFVDMLRTWKFIICYELPLH